MESLNKIKYELDNIKRTYSEKVFFWSAYDIMLALEFNDWDYFEEFIERAIKYCESAKFSRLEYFQYVFDDANGRKDYMLTRYACFLLTMQFAGSNDKAKIMAAYFADPTLTVNGIENRIEEINRIEVQTKLSEQEKILSENIYLRGVDEKGFARIRSKGDEALFSMPTATFKAKIGIKNDRPLADFLPLVTMLAKQLATEITNINIKNKDLQGEVAITEQHVSSNSTLRNALLSEGIIPEEQPVAEDINKVKIRIKRDEKSIAKNSGHFET